MIRLALPLSATLLLAAIPAGAQVKASDIEALDWGTTPNVSRYGNLYFAGQIDARGIDEAKKAGLGVVLNLRGADEIDWDEKSAVEAAGLRYVSVPVVGSSFSKEAFDEIERLVAEHGEDGLLIHCGSSNRVGGWFATHLVTQHGQDEESAFEAGRAAGMTSSRIVARAKKYLEEHE